MIWGIVYTWAQNLQTPQLILFGIATFCFLLVFIRFIVDRWQKHNIERIPDLIEKLDVLTSNFIDDFTINLSTKQWTDICRDYGSILGLNIENLITVASRKTSSKDELSREFESFNRAYNRKLDPQNKTQETLVNLGDMGGLLDTYNVGLSQLKETNQYKKLDEKIKILQRKAPSAYISVKVNEYYSMSEKFYVMLLGIKPIYDHPELIGRLPAKINAKKGQIQPMVEGQIANLIAGVRESILKYKERNLEQKNAEQNTDRADVKNRQQRRASR